MGDIEELDRMLSGFRTSQLIRAGALLGIFDAFESGSKSAAEVASAAMCAPEPTLRLMRALSAVGVLVELPDGSFETTSMGALLRSKDPSAMKSLAISRLDDRCWSAWGALPEAIRTGDIAYELANANPFWEDLRQDASAAATFNSFMGSRSRGYVPSLLPFLDCSQPKVLVDVGGGQGTLLAGLLNAWPQAKGILFDQPSGLMGAESYLATQGVSERITLVPGDFFVSVPKSGDLYFLRRILHDWTDDDAVRILRCVREAMTSDDSRLMVSELLLPTRAEPGPDHEARFHMDMHMFVLFGARERSEVAFRDLLGSTGFALETVLRTSPEETIIARPT